MDGVANIGGDDAVDVVDAAAVAAAAIVVAAVAAIINVAAKCASITGNYSGR